MYRLFLCIFVIGGLFGSECAGPSCRFSVGTRQGKGIGYDEGYFSARGFLTPNWQKPFQPFLDARIHMFNNSRLASNVGVGARLMTPIDWAFGVNGYYDFRSEKALSPHEMGFGFEALSECVDLRYNVYIPVAETERKGPARLVGFDGASPIVSRRLSAAYGGMDAEVGFPIRGYFKPIEFYLGLSPYYLFRKEVSGFNFGNSFGGRARINMRILDGFDLGGQISYDRLFHGRVNGYVRISLPWSPSTLIFEGRRWKDRFRGCMDLARERKILTQPVQRQEIIPMKQKKRTAVGQDPFSGHPLSLVFVDNTMLWPGSGSFESPFRSLALAEEHSKPGQTIYVLPGDGTSQNLDAGIVLKEGQSLHGSSVPLAIDDTYYPADERCACIKGTVTLSGNNQVRGLVIDGSVEGREAGDFVVADVEFICGGIDAARSPPGVKSVKRSTFKESNTAIALGGVKDSHVLVCSNVIEPMEHGIVFGGPSIVTIQENQLHGVEKGIMGELESGWGFYTLRYNEVDTIGTGIGFTSTGHAQLIIDQNTVAGRDRFDDSILLLSGSDNKNGIIEASVIKNSLTLSDSIFKVQNKDSKMVLRYEGNMTDANVALINYAKDPSCFSVEALNLNASGLSSLNFDAEVLVPFEPVEFTMFDEGLRFFTPFAGTR